MSGSSVEAVLPLLASQRGVYVEAASFPALYIGQQRLELTGRLEPGRLEAAWDRVRARHQGLRSTVRSHRDTVVQLVWATRAGEQVKTYDLRGIREDDRRQVAAAICDEEAGRGVDPSREPPMRLSLLILTPTLTWVCVTHHHLGIDGRSLSVVYDDLASEYEGRGPERADRPSLVAVYRALVPARNEMPDRVDVPAHPMNALAEPFLAPTGSAGLTLSAVCQPSAVFKAAEQAGITPASVLMATWLRCLAARTGADAVSCAISRDIRPASLPGADSVVGMLTETDLLAVDLRPGRDLPHIGREVQAALAGERPLPPLANGLRGMWRAGSTGRPDSVVTIYSSPSLPRMPGSMTWRLLWASETTEFPLDVTFTLSGSLAVEVVVDLAVIDPAEAQALLDDLMRLCAEPGAAIVPRVQPLTASVRTVPREGAAAVLDEVMRRVIGREVPSRTDFTALGMDSLALVSVASGLTAAGWSIPVGQLLELRTVDRVLAAMDAAGARTERAQEHGHSNDPSPVESDLLCRTEEAGWGSAPMQEQSSLVFDRRVDPERFAAAAERVLAHFPSLDRCWTGSAPQLLAPRRAPWGMAVMRVGDDAGVGPRLEDARRADLTQHFVPDGSPLLRLAVVLGPARTGLLISFHSALLDGWSFGTFVRALQAAYDLPPGVRLPGSDSASWRRAIRTRAGDPSEASALLAQAVEASKAAPVFSSPRQATSDLLVPRALVAHAADSAETSAASTITAAAAEACARVLGLARQAPVGLRMSLRDGSVHAGARTVGRLTTDVPFLPGSGSLGELASRVGRTTRLGFTAGHAGERPFAEALGVERATPLVQTTITVENYFRFDEDMMRLVDGHAWPEVSAWRRNLPGAARLVSLAETAAGWAVELSTTHDRSPTATADSIARAITEVLGEVRA